MKKVLSCLITSTLLLLLVVNAAWAGSDFTLVGKVGMDGGGEISSRIDDEEVDNDTLCIAVEGLADLNRRVMLGIGFELQEEQDLLALSFDQGNVHSVKYTPVYGVLRLMMPVQSRRVKLFCLGKIGLSNFQASNYETENGLYFGAGLGFLYRQAFLVELDYSVHEGAIEANGQEHEITYSKLTLAAGFNFNL